MWVPSLLVWCCGTRGVRFGDASDEVQKLKIDGFAKSQGTGIRHVLPLRYQ